MNLVTIKTTLRGTAITIHVLKCEPQYFDALKCGLKSFELRYNADRDFQAGDILVIREFYAGNYVGTPPLVRSVDYVLSEHEGLAPDYCILSLSFLGASDESAVLGHVFGRAIVS